MTYDEIVEWASRAYPMKMYESYSSWLSDVEQDFESQNHFFPSQCYDLMESAWNNKHPQKPVQPLEHYDQRKTNRERLLYRLTYRRPTESFSPSFIADEFKLNRRTTRESFRRLLKDGKLRRVSRGKYQFVV